MSFWSRYCHTSFGDDYEYDFDGPEETRKAFTDVRFRRSDGTFELKSISWCEANGAVERDGYWEAPTSDLYEDESDPSQPFAGLDRLWEWDFMTRRNLGLKLWDSVEHVASDALLESSKVAASRDLMHQAREGGNVIASYLRACQLIPGRAAYEVRQHPCGTVSAAVSGQALVPLDVSKDAIKLQVIHRKRFHSLLKLPGLEQSAVAKDLFLPHDKAVYDCIGFPMHPGEAFVVLPWEERQDDETLIKNALSILRMDADHESRCRAVTTTSNDAGNSGRETKRARGA